MSIFTSDDNLIAGILNQDESAISYLYTDVGPKVKQYIISKGGSAEEAEDIFQEGVIAAYVNIKSGKYSKESGTRFTTYLTQVCKYKWYDVLKSGHKKNSSYEVIETADDTSIIEAIEVGEKYEALHSVIGKLGEQCQKILKLFYWENKSIEEISKTLHMVAASVKNGKYRCMQQLKGLAKDNLQLK